MKRILCLVCAVLMIVLCFAGCAEKATAVTVPSTSEVFVTWTEPSETEPSVTEPTATEVLPPEEEWRRDATEKYNVYIHNYYEYKWLEDGNTP